MINQYPENKTAEQSKILSKLWVGPFSTKLKHDIFPRITIIMFQVTWQSMSGTSPCTNQSMHLEHQQTGQPDYFLRHRIHQK
jgi:hypothetical protein